MCSKRLRFALSSIVAALLLVGTAVPAQAQLGVAGGLNFESADDIKASGNTRANLENSTGYHLGLVYELGLGPLNVRPGFFYRKVGAFDFSEIRSDLSDPKYTVSAWEVPLDLRLTLLSAPLISPYILGGPKATIPRGEDEFDNAVEDLSYTFNVGVGAQISLPGSSMRLQPELRYEFGATKFIKEGKTVQLGDNQFSFTPEESPRFSTFAVRLNILF